MSTKFQNSIFSSFSKSFYNVFLIFLAASFYELCSFFFISNISGEQLLSFILLCLFLQTVLPIFFNKKYIVALKTSVLYSSVFIFLMSLELLAKLDCSILKLSNSLNSSLKPFHFSNELYFLSSDSLNVYFTYAVDGISIYFLILTTFLTPICILVS